MLIDACTVLTEDAFCGKSMFVRGKKEVSFESFRSDVAAYASCFAKTVMGREVVLYLSKNSYLFYVCFMALLHAGKNVVLPSFLTEGNVEDIILPGNNTVITDLKFEKDGVNVINPKDCELFRGDDLRPIGKRYVTFFTSGTTGKPKRIRKPFSTLVSEVGNIYFYQKKIVAQNPVVIASIMPNHMYGVLWRFLFPMCTGLKQDLDMVMSPETIIEKQAAYPKVIFATTPSLMDKLAEYKEQYVYGRNCIAVYSSGSLLSLKTSEAVSEIFGTSPFEIFGSTETGGIAYRRQSEGDEWHIFPTVNTTLDERSCLVINSDFCVSVPFVTHDAVEMLDMKTFKLNGRLDRMVKIAENRVFLPEMENRMMDFSMIYKAYVLPMENNNRTVLAAVIALSEKGKEYLKENGKKQLIADLKDYMSSWFENTVIPKKYRIVNEIPVNERGKIINSEIEKIFDSAYVEPLIEKVIWRKDSFSAELTFMEDAPYFKGHFPDYPILPGVIQLYFAVNYLNHYFEKNIKTYTVNKLKFTSLIRPMQTVPFSVVRKSDTEYVFTYGDEDKKFSSGIIVLGKEQNV